MLSDIFGGSENMGETELAETEQETDAETAVSFDSVEDISREYEPENVAEVLADLDIAGHKMGDWIYVHPDEVEDDPQKEMALIRLGFRTERDDDLSLLAIDKEDARFDGHYFHRGPDERPENIWGEPEQVGADADN